jgi:regulatory protein
MEPHAEQGAEEATIIPFPLHRVSAPVQVHADGEPAPIQPLPSIPDASKEALATLSAAMVSPETPSGREEAPEASAKVVKRAHNVSLHALAGRDMSRFEVKQRLEQRELPSEVVELELEELTRQGLIDDDALARELVDRYANRRGMAKPVVAQKLRQRKLDPTSVEAALAELDGEVEASKLDDLARERLRKMGDLDPVTTKRRLAGYLQRKGFSSSEVFTTIDRVLSSH